MGTLLGAGVEMVARLLAGTWPGHQQSPGAQAQGHIRSERMLERVRPRSPVAGELVQLHRYSPQRERG